MEYKLKFFWFIVFGFFLFTCHGCKDEIPVLPDVSTTEITLITPISANCSGVAISHGSSTIIEKGICWSNHPQPTIFDNIISAALYPYFVSFNLRISGLIENTIYYVRAYATSNDGTGYGNELTFNTTDDISGQTGTVDDIEGNVYATIGIGSQIWMSENLKTTKYNDATEILQVIEDDVWSRLDGPPTGAFCWYNNDETMNKEIYGALYNWYAVSTDKLCPSGWHVPSFDEWAILESYLGGATFAGGKMKVTGTDYWKSPNEGATNESGFSALPGGFRPVWFEDLGEGSIFWTSSGNQTHHAWYKTISAYSAALMEGANNNIWGLSIRCVKD